VVTRITCVLRSGGEYRPDHVIRLRDQVRRHSDLDFICLSDLAVPGIDVIPLRHGWPGWWAKMEMFRPDIVDDLLYLDLDSAVVGDLSDLAGIGRTAIMRDVYRPSGLQSSIMFLADRDRGPVWRSFVADAARWMHRFRGGGDQAFLERVWRNRLPAIWQDQLPGQVVSYKVHVRPAQRPGREFGNGSLPDGARVVVFHGKPRPWEVGW